MAKKQQELDTHAITELQLFIENDSELYTRQTSPIHKNLMTKISQGKYDHEKAQKLFVYLVEAGDKKYQKQYGSSTKGYMLDVPSRKELARILEEEFYEMAKAGEYDIYIPKKYAKKELAKGGKVSTKDWKKEALKLLRKEEDNKDLNEGNMGISYVGDDSAFYAVSAGYTQYLVFKDIDMAEYYAEQYVEEMINDEPESFSADFIQQHYYVSDTDRRIISGEESDRAVEDAEYENSEITEGEKEEIRDRVYNEWYDGLKNPISFLVDELGIYRMEDVKDISFIMVDSRDAAKEAVNIDGIAHFISRYDGNEIDLGSGYVAYRIN